MNSSKIVAMLLAGGQGSRLGALTRRVAKPAVGFGGKYRIIDFSLSNCANSGINIVGVLTQYKPFLLNSYIGTGEAWDMDGGLFVLPPYYTEVGGEWYRGTADAIFRNIEFIDGYAPQYVLILSGDHLYKMDYRPMLEFHEENEADLTVSVIEVAPEDASRFGIMSTDENMRITKFEEKPKEPESCLASMGIYIFSWDVLRQALIADNSDEASENDFGRNVIPALLGEGKRLFAYKYSGYWKDVGTIESYYDAQMDLLNEEPEFDIFAGDMKIMSNSNSSSPQYIGEDASVEGSMVCNGCTVLGSVRGSILSTDVFVGKDAHVENSILLPGATVEDGACVKRAIIGEKAVVSAMSVFEGGDEIAVLGDAETGGEESAK
ncbi:MAG: glucose-1-phosphate adenylyltransferase [Oscillospiraceae bacterium]|nr:glucose-1-phosphate adenylyltransferase [Oscillospiraceae bacterium]